MSSIVLLVSSKMDDEELTECIENWSPRVFGLKVSGFYGGTTDMKY